MNAGEITKRIEPILRDAILRLAAVAEGDHEAVNLILALAARGTYLAALDAIREPSDKIIDAGYREDSLRRRYVAIIDALKREIAPKHTRG